MKRIQMLYETEFALMRAEVGGPVLDKIFLEAIGIDKGVSMEAPFTCGEIADIPGIDGFLYHLNGRGDSDSAITVCRKGANSAPQSISPLHKRTQTIGACQAIVSILLREEEWRAKQKKAKKARLAKKKQQIKQLIKDIQDSSESSAGILSARMFDIMGIKGNQYDAFPGFPVGSVVLDICLDPNGTWFVCNAAKNGNPAIYAHTNHKSATLAKYIAALEMFLLELEEAK